jgi:isoleucyl-tRNA synthetase
MFKPIEPKPDFPKLEEEVLKFWEDNQIFEKSLERTKNGKPYTFYDGPPFATGLPHYGHILASTVKDLFPRYQTMNGRFVRRRWGWDCHGLPIEEIVERKLGISGKKDIEKIGIQKFNETCRSMVLEFVDEWRKTIKRIARWVDFDNSYKTMDRDYMESVWWAFKQIYDKGLVYESRRVLLYCPRCETPVSNFEVAMDNSYKDVTEEAVTVKFKVKGQENTYLLAWTTTPWTLPGNVALAVGKDIGYVKWSNGNEHYILAEELAPKYFSDFDPSKAETMLLSALEDLEYEPLFDLPELRSNKTHKVYAADFVNTEEGTGIVHTAVVYGEDDYNLGVRERLPIVPMLDEKGVFNDKAPKLIQGMYFKDSEKIIKKDLENSGLMFAKKQHQHSYPHCWRCGTTLYYNAIPAWFINIQKIKSGLLKSNEKEINWYPEHLKHGRYQKSVEAAPDWNISRNRYWGNPIPVWKCEDGHNTVVGSVRELKVELKDLHRPFVDDVILKCKECGKEARRITEIFDSWVEAGSMPFAEYHYPFENKSTFESRFPGQFVAEYIAQTRAWFYVMHVISYNLLGKAPFENVVTTGTILAEDGSKMSKSKNNYPDPWEVIGKYGVDALRFYLMNSTVMNADNLNFNEKDLAIAYRKNILILWNVYNYFVTYANEANWESKEGTDKVTVLDRWILAKTTYLSTYVTSELNNYNTVRATRAIEDYINELSTWYLRRSRGRKDQEFFATLHHCLLVLSKLMAPITPYISELIYKNLDGKESVHLEDWPKDQKLTKDQQEILDQMQIVRNLVEQGHSLRKASSIKLRQPLLSFTYVAQKPLPKEFEEILADELNVQIVKLGDKLEFDLNMTPELKKQGLAAELERTVQEMRKKSGLKVGEIVNLSYDTNDNELIAAFDLFDTKKTYIDKISKGSGGEKFEIDGKSVALALSK